MTLLRIEQIRMIATQQQDAHPGAVALIRELIAAIEDTNQKYIWALEFGWSDRYSKGVAFSQLKNLCLQSENGGNKV